MIDLILFERLNSLRGMQNVFLDFYLHKRETHRLIEALTDYLLELIRYWAEIGVDALFLTDDWGTQRSLMISLEMWREFFKARYGAIFDEVHRCGMDVLFHSCGNITQLIPELIDLGVDIINPLQPTAMDLNEIARVFAGDVAFWGGIDNQHLLVEATPEQVKEEVHRTIDLLGKPFGNAYIVSPSNLMTPEIPLENTRALCEACHER